MMMMMIPMHVYKYKWTGSLQLLFVTELNSKRSTEYNFRWYFQWTFLKIKNVGKIKNVKKRKNGALNKKRKNVFLHLGSRVRLQTLEGLHLDECISSWRRSLMTALIIDVVRLLVDVRHVL